MQAKYENVLLKEAEKYAKKMAYSLAKYKANERINFNYKEIRNETEFDYFIKLNNAVIEGVEIEIINCLMTLPPNHTEAHATVGSIKMNLKLFMEQWLQLNSDNGKPDEFSQIFCLAAAAGIAPLVQSLLEDERIDPTFQDYLAVNAASYGNHLDVINLFIKDKRITPFQLLRQAVLSDNVALAKSIMTDLEVDPSANDNIIIQEVVIWGKPEMIEFVLEDKRVDPSANNNQALINAVMYLNDFALQKLLQDPRVDPSANKNKAIRWSLHDKNTDRLELLLKHSKLDPSLNLNEHIKEAFFYDNQEGAALLLQDKRSAQEEISNDLIMLAATKGFKEIVWLMVARKGIYNPYVNEMITLLKNENHDPIVEYIKKQLIHAKLLVQAATNGDREIVWLMVARKGIYNPYVNKMITLLKNENHEPIVEYIENQLIHAKIEAAKKHATFFAQGHQPLPREIMNIIQDDYVKAYRGD